MFLPAQRLSEAVFLGTDDGRHQPELSVKQYLMGPTVLRACPLSPWHTALQAFLFAEDKGMHGARQMDHGGTAVPTDAGSL